jgi:Tfp pilus assembly protein FimT
MEKMYWLKEDGMTVTEMTIVFALASIVTLSAFPFFNNLIKDTHQAKVMLTYNNIKTSIMISSADSMLANGNFRVPLPHQVTSDKIISLPDSNNWINDGKGTWTYLPMEAKIVYNRTSADDYSLKIIYKD